MNNPKKRLSIHELKWLKYIRDYSIRNKLYYIVIGTEPLTAYLYTGGGFLVETKTMPQPPS